MDNYNNSVQFENKKLQLVDCDCLAMWKKLREKDSHTTLN